MSGLRSTLLSELEDIYDAEKQLVKALPKMAKAASHGDLRRSFESHLEQTESHIERLEQVFDILGETAKGKKCKGMQGLLAEGEELIEQEEGDAALICGAQKVEHYEIATYGSLCAWAQLLGEEEVFEVLEETLDEERAADERLTSLAESVINRDESDNEKAEPQETE
jgi:ferritin-like metal-binding protein YciE